MDLEVLIIQGPVVEGEKKKSLIIVIRDESIGSSRMCAGLPWECQPAPVVHGRREYDLPGSSSEMWICLVTIMYLGNRSFCCSWVFVSSIQTRTASCVFFETRAMPSRVWPS